MNEEFVQESIRKFLADNGWDYAYKGAQLRQQGVDIVVRDGKNKNKARYFFIECKGQSTATSHRSMNETNFVFALGQIVTRMKVIARHAYKYGLGLPEKSATIASRRIPWQVARHICLHIFSVNELGNVKLYGPREIKALQLKSSKV